VVEEQTGEGIYIAGAVGPTGQKLEPEGSLSTEGSPQTALKLHIGTLLRAGVDVLLLETFTDRTRVGAGHRGGES
jgi:methionine synthase I (cobalamin-dependent)